MRRSQGGPRSRPAASSSSSSPTTSTARSLTPSARASRRTSPRATAAIATSSRSAPRSALAGRTRGARGAPGDRGPARDVPRLPARRVTPPAGGRLNLMPAISRRSPLTLLAAPAVAAIVLTGVWVAGGVISDDFRTSMALTAAWFAISGAACATGRTPPAHAAGPRHGRLRPHRGGRRRLPRRHDAARRVVHERVITRGSGARAIERADGQSAGGARQARARAVPLARARDHRHRPRDRRHRRQPLPHAHRRSRPHPAPTCASGSSRAAPSMAAPTKPSTSARSRAIAATSSTPSHATST